MNGDGHDIGALPRRRDPYHVGQKIHCPGHQCCNDCHDPAIAIEHGRSRGAMIEHQTIVPIVNFKKCGTGEFVIAPLLDEATAP